MKLIEMIYGELYWSFFAEVLKRIIEAEKLKLGGFTLGADLLDFFKFFGDERLDRAGIQTQG